MRVRQPGVLILDFGAQYTQLIARRVREMGVYCEIHPFWTVPTREIGSLDVEALILSGGPASVTEEGAPTLDAGWLNFSLPTLGICYGMQLLAHMLGGSLGRGESREYGPANIVITENNSLFAGFEKGESAVWMSHGDHVQDLPPGFRCIASSKGAPIAAFEHTEKKIYGVQFHPEVVHSHRGFEMLKNFVSTISHIPAEWTPANLIEQTVEELREKVAAEENVICALSGGVDSTVAAVLIHKAIGKRLHCIFVDNGLLRKSEGNQVLERLLKLGLQVKRVNAEKRFLDALAGVTDPEQKRKIIGRVFIEVFDEEAKSIPNVTHLVQGTLYPDVIESVSVRGPSATIKSHHNVGGLPERMKLKLLEPFRELFKDEVRKVGLDLGVPEEILHRQPFPGPGLAVRVLGDLTKEKLDIVREADVIFQEEIRASGLYTSLWQSFAVLLPVCSVGVMGDGRTYEQTIALRAVHSTDGMTADWAYLPEQLLRKASNRIINEVRGVNRVVYDISSKPPATIEWE